MKEHTSKSLRLLLIIIRFKNYIVANYKPLRKRLLSFFLFVLLSLTFWFYRALDDVYLTTIKYPIRYINIPTNKTLSGNPPKEIVLRVKGKGFTILSNRINAPTLDLDVNDFSLFSQSKDSLQLFMLSRNAHTWFTSELTTKNNQVLEIVSITPDTISFNFTRTGSKRIPVKAIFANTQKLFAQQHMLNGKINVNPDSILVVGPANLLDTLHYINTLPIRISDLKDTTNKRVGLSGIPGLSLTVEKVKVMIPVDRFTESSIEVPVSIWHTPDSIDIKVFPRSVKITFIVTFSMYNKSKSTDFYPFVDYNDIEQKSLTENTRLKVHLDTIPYYAHSVNIYPSNVEFLIELTHAKSRINRGYRQR